jgi:hypothetical protein
LQRNAKCCIHVFGVIRFQEARRRLAPVIGFVPQNPYPHPAGVSSFRKMRRFFAYFLGSQIEERMKR